MEKKKILIVEDDAALARGLSIRLRHAGYQVQSAPDVVTGTLMTRRERPDLVILDLGLPGGDGLDVVDRAANFGWHTPFIILTARDPEDYLDRAFTKGVDGLFTKPVDNERLLDAIEGVLSDQPRPMTQS